MQVVDFLFDSTLVTIKPLQKSIPERGRSDVLERGYKVEINNVRRIM
jgi:hypothetical protein